MWNYPKIPKGPIKLVLVRPGLWAADPDQKLEYYGPFEEMPIFKQGFKGRSSGVLSEFTRRSLERVVKEIGQSFSDSGGDHEVNTSLNLQAAEHGLTEDEKQFVRMRLIKIISSYEG